MSIGPVNLPAVTSAGGQLAQRTADMDRASHDVASQQGSTASQVAADSAAGIAQTDGDSHEAHDRDADGRRLWELPGQKQTPTPDDASTTPPVQSKDATGERGNELDLSG